MRQLAQQVRARAIIALFVIIATAMAAPSRTGIAWLSAPRISDDEKKLTADEEREAGSLAIRFVKEFQKPLDIAEVPDELFVSDLADRIRRQSPNESFSIPADEGVVKNSSDVDLRRYFLTITNFNFLLWALVEADHFKLMHIEKKSECRRESECEKLLPPEAVAVLANDPTFGADFAKQLPGNEDSVNEEKAEEGNDRISSPEGLKVFLALLEEATAITRKHLNNLPEWQQARMHVPYFEPGINEDEPAVSVETTKLSEDFLGEREGAQVICARILMFHLDLVRVDGRLKILSVSSEDYHIQTREQISRAKRVSELMHSIEVDDMEAFDSIVRSGIDVNAKDDECTTPLVYAAMSKRLEMVKALIARGADVNVGNRYGNTPLIYAAGAADEEMTKALLDAGADVNSRSENGWTALHFASDRNLNESYRKVVQLLESRGAIQ